MATIYCMNCGTPLEEGVLFCDACGSPTLLGAGLIDPPGKAQIACPDCGALNDAGSEFCKECGHALATGPISVEEAARAVIRPSAVRATHAARKTSSTGAFVALVLVAALGVVAVGLAFATGILQFGTPSEQVAVRAPEVSEEPEPEAEAEQALPSTDVRESLTNYSWSELAIIGQALSQQASREEALELAKSYNLVDPEGRMRTETKTVDIEGLGSVPMRLADVYHDDLANTDGKAGLTFLASDLTLVHRLREADVNEGGWEATELRGWLASDVYAALDQELAPSIVAVNKLTNNTGNTGDVAAVTATPDMLWIPSTVEVTGPIDWSWWDGPAGSDAYNAVMNAEGSQYACFADMGIRNSEGNAGLILSGTGGVNSWWLRSSCANMSQHYRQIDNTGNPNRWGNAAVERGVLLGFCL